MSSLTSSGWLFPVQTSGGRDTENRIPWDYWSLYDFSNVEWSALKAAAPDIALTVLMGIIDLPVYTRAISASLNDARYSMDREILGHGVSNLLGGLMGTIPNLV
ncbi:MAG: hypothetical protein M1820_001736, partial [Bogoriella megaspora]